MSCNLYECLQKCQAGDESSIIELLSRLSPMLAAGAHYLGYEDAYNDLVIYLLAEIKDLKLYTLRNTTDAGIITYFQQVVHHKISRLAIKHRKYNSISYFSELSDGALCSIELKTANNNTYNNLILTDICVCISLVLLTSCTAHITVEPQTSPSPTTTLTPDSSSASASSSNTGASEGAPAAAPTPAATPESTPFVSSSSETATSGDEALIKEAEFLVKRLVKYTFDSSIKGGITDINTALEEDPSMLPRLFCVFATNMDDLNLYASYGQYSEDGWYVYISKSDAASLANRLLGLNEIPESAFQFDYNSEQQRFEFSTASGFLDSYSYTNLKCTVDNASRTVHAQFNLTDSGSYESNEVYGPYEMIFDIISDGDTQYLRFKSVLPI